MHETTCARIRSALMAVLPSRSAVDLEGRQSQSRSSRPSKRKVSLDGSSIVRQSHSMPQRLPPPGCPPDQSKFDLHRLTDAKGPAGWENRAVEIYEHSTTGRAERHDKQSRLVFFDQFRQMSGVVGIALKFKWRDRRHRKPHHCRMPIPQRRVEFPRNPPRRPTGVVVHKALAASVRM